MRTLLFALLLSVSAMAASAQTIATYVRGDSTATNSLIATTKACKVFAITGYSASTQYIQIFGTNAVPANGVKALFSVPVSAGQFYSIDFSYYGADLDGLVICNSSTVNTLTIGSADTTFTAILRR